MADYPGRDIYSANGWFVYDDGSRALVFDYGGVVELTIEDLLLECRILGGGAFVRSEVLHALDGFREHMYGEDYDLWLRALSRGYTHVASPEPLYIYHRCIKGQKSDDPVAGYMSAVTALNDLIDSRLLTPQQEKKVRTSIAHYLAGPTLEEQAQQLRRGVERVFGKRLARPVLAGIHSVSWIARPVRRWLAGKKH
jgi:GT2 family glycosyltransferase